MNGPVPGFPVHLVKRCQVHLGRQEYLSRVPTPEECPHNDESTKSKKHNGLPF